MNAKKIIMTKKKKHNASFLVFECFLIFGHIVNARDDGEQDTNAKEHIAHPQKHGVECADADFGHKK